MYKLIGPIDRVFTPILSWLIGPGCYQLLGLVIIWGLSNIIGL